MSTSSQNPFQSPQSVSGPVLDLTQYDDQIRYSFEGQIQPGDVIPYSQRSIGFALLLYGALFFGGCWIIRNTGQVPGALVFLLSLLAFLLIRVYLSPALKRRSLVKNFPGLFEPMSGFVSEHRIYFDREHDESELLLSSIVSFRAIEDRMLIHFSHHRILPTVLKRDFFKDGQFDAVKNMIQTRGLGLEKKRIASVDSRIAELPPEYPISPAPSGAISFIGPVTAEDCEGSPYARFQRKVFINQSLKSLVPAVTCALMFLFFPFIGIPELAILCVVLTAFFFFRIQRHLARVIPRGDTCIYQIRGWLHESGLETGISYGRTRYQWSSFSAHAITDKNLSLLFTGYRPIFVVLTPQQFDSKNDWEKACELIRTQVPVNALA